MLLFGVVNGGSASGSAWLLWTLVFNRMGVKILTERNKLNNTPINNHMGETYKDSNIINIKKTNVALGVSENTIVEKSLPQICFCRKCGNKLLEDSDFCSYCGTQVVREVNYEM